MVVLEPGEAYRLWAPAYAEETVISFLDNELARELSPSLEGKRLLDAGCGTGRRMAAQNATLAIGVDLSFEMLAAGMAECITRADVRALPFPHETFDLIWCRLVLGHLRDPRAAYRELARVCRIGGKMFVSDFHPAAVAAGHRRTFRDGPGQEYAVEHHMHDVTSHKQMAAATGLTLISERDGEIGPRVEAFYARGGRRAAYQRDFGLSVVAAFLFERTR